MENDLIRRSDAISQSFPVTFSNGLEPYDVDVVAVGHIKSIPAVDAVEVVHAYWKHVHDDDCYWSECSNCGGDMPLNRYRQEWESLVCPTCGARMDGRKEDGDENE